MTNNDLEEFENQQIKMLNNDLYKAVENNEFDIVKTLIENGADVNTRDEVDRSPLFLASYKRNIEIVRLLLDYGARINDVNLLDDTTRIAGSSALHGATEDNHPEIVRF